MFQTQFGVTLKSVWYDNSNEYISDVFKSYGCYSTTYVHLHVWTKLGCKCKIVFLRMWIVSPSWHEYLKRFSGMSVFTVIFLTDRYPTAFFFGVVPIQFVKYGVPLFLIEPCVVGCVCLVQDYSPHMYYLDVTFLGYEVHKLDDKSYQVCILGYLPNPWEYVLGSSFTS